MLYYKLYDFIYNYNNKIISNKKYKIWSKQKFKSL